VFKKGDLSPEKGNEQKKKKKKNLRRRRLMPNGNEKKGLIFSGGETGRIEIGGRAVRKRRKRKQE